VGWVKVAAKLIFFGFNLTFFPQFIVGYVGTPRRYAAYYEKYQVLKVMSSAGASILGVGYLIPMIYFLWSLRYGPVAGPNPWKATGLEWQTPMLYAIGFIGLFTIGGLTGLFLAAVGLDVHVTDTYFIIAHFHYIMVGGTLMGYLGGLHYWWPKISGRLYPEFLAKLSAGIIFLGFNLTFFPQFVLGYLGMPRRYHAYPPEFQVLNVLSSAGASILGVGYLIPMIYLMWSLRYGRLAGSNPWGAVGLEWTTTSPPPTENFAETPVITSEVYDYSAPLEDHVA